MKIYPYVDSDGHKVSIKKCEDGLCLVEYEDGDSRWLASTQLKCRVEEEIRDASTEMH